MWNLSSVHNYLRLLDVQEKFRRNENKMPLLMYLPCYRQLENNVSKRAEYVIELWEIMLWRKRER